MIELFECVLTDDSGIFKSNEMFGMRDGATQAEAEQEVFEKKGVRVRSGKGNAKGDYLKEVNFVKTVSSVWLDDFIVQ